MQTYILSELIKQVLTLCKAPQPCITRHLAQAQSSLQSANKIRARLLGARAAQSATNHQSGGCAHCATHVRLALWLYFWGQMRTNSTTCETALSTFNAYSCVYTSIQIAWTVWLFFIPNFLQIKCKLFYNWNILVYMIKLCNSLSTPCWLANIKIEYKIKIIWFSYLNYLQIKFLKKSNINRGARALNGYRI